jgi:hypothetical protein
MPVRLSFRPSTNLSLAEPPMFGHTRLHTYQPAPAFLLSDGREQSPIR